MFYMLGIFQVYDNLPNFDLQDDLLLDSTSVLLNFPIILMKEKNYLLNSLVIVYTKVCKKDLMSFLIHLKAIHIMFNHSVKTLKHSDFSPSERRNVD